MMLVMQRLFQCLPKTLMLIKIHFSIRIYMKCSVSNFAEHYNDAG